MTLTPGAGGMGEVYRARDTRLAREVALKLLPISRQDDQSLRARFEREAQTLAALSHPNIAAIYDLIDVGDHRAIVMELVAGPTLREVAARGRVPLRLAIGYAVDISDALSSAHAAGIVHRDLKPANVVVTNSGSAKVLDFGLAKLAAADDATAVERTTMAVTEERMIVGTLGYLSPEQAHGRPADARSDIFSLGVVLYELISGRRAFQGESSAALLSAVLRDDRPLLRTVDASIPRSVERLVARCLEKDPRRRYQNVSDVKAALEDVREDLSAPSSPGLSLPMSHQRNIHPDPGARSCTRRRFSEPLAWCLVSRPRCDPLRS
jgi:serine/threonine protein kinase